MLVEKLLYFGTKSECLNFYIIGRKMEYLSMREQREARRTELCRCMGVEVLWWQPSHWGGRTVMTTFSLYSTNMNLQGVLSIWWLISSVTLFNIIFIHLLPQNFCIKSFNNPEIKKKLIR